jgi:hypothetical protein
VPSEHKRPLKGAIEGRETKATVKAGAKVEARQSRSKVKSKQGNSRSKGAVEAKGAVKVRVTVEARAPWSGK